MMAKDVPEVTESSDDADDSSSVPLPSRLVDVPSGVMAANLLSAPKPSYPTLASLTRMQGNVVMKAVISNDVKNDPQRLMRKELDERGINSLTVIPLIVGGEAVGVLSLYAADVGFFDDEEMRLLVELAGDVSFALEHIGKAEKLDYLAYYDELTGLANRTLFLERVAQKLIAAGSAKKVAVFALDVDRFRGINDALGRQAGDDMIRRQNKVVHGALCGLCTTLGPCRS